MLDVASVETLVVDTGSAGRVLTLVGPRVGLVGSATVEDGDDGALVVLAVVGG